MEYVKAKFRLSCKNYGRAIYECLMNVKDDET